MTRFTAVAQWGVMITIWRRPNRELLVSKTIVIEPMHRGQASWAHSTVWFQMCPKVVCKMTYSHTGCICLLFLHCEFSNVPWIWMSSLACPLSRRKSYKNYLPCCPCVTTGFHIAWREAFCLSYVFSAWLGSSCMESSPECMTGEEAAGRLVLLGQIFALCLWSQDSRGCMAGFSSCMRVHD